MGAAIGYALRRTSARVVLLIGAGGLLWLVVLAEPYRPPGVASVSAVPFLWRIDPYRVVGSGFPRWDLAAAAVVAVGAAVVGSVLWRDRSTRR